MLNNLKHILVTIIILTLIFITCLICYMSANTQLINYEKSKTSIFSFNNTYNNVFNEIIEEAKQYISTGNISTKLKFSTYSENFTNCNKINSTYINFSSTDSRSNFEIPTKLNNFSDNDHTTFSLNPNEQDLLLSYLDCYNQLLDITLQAVNQRDSSFLKSDNFINLESLSNNYCNEYTSLYVNRIQQESAKLEYHLDIITISLIFIIIILALSISKAISLYLKNNQYNVYFNQLYSKAIENADVGMSIVDKHYKFEYMNATYKQLLNIQSPNPIGQTAFALLPEQISATLPSHSLTENKKNLILSYTHEGFIRYINYNCFTIFDNKDEPKFITLIQDCTDSHRKDNELKQQLKEIEFYANAKSSFVANVSHEIKTPLNAIIGMSHVLKSTNLTNKQNNILSKIHVSSELLLNIINDVLDISKIQKSDFTLYPSDFNLLNMLNEAEEIFKPIISNKGLEYIKEFNISSNLCLSADKTRLTQVLLNLVNNACKFTSKGHIRIAIEPLEGDKNSILLKFTIEDTGLGIEEEDVLKVFQEFEQLENHLTKQHQGTGLGLSICKHVVNAMGGDIWVESQIGVGSKFHFTIRAHTADSTLFEVAKATSNVLPLLDGANRKVLVVEDTELNYEVTQNLLSDSQIICEHACDGQEAINMCIKAPENYYTVILMDIHMPNMDGYTAAEILKTEIGITCPIIALTATNIDTDTREKYKDIIDDFISKPFRFQDFYRSLLPYFNSSRTSKLSNVQLTSEKSETKDCSSNLNFSEAARNLGCSEKQYIKHLTKFKTSYCQVDIDIQNLLLDENYTEAHRIAHSVKGLAGTLGLVPLQKVAAELEAALKEQSDKAATLLPIFKDQLDGVCKNKSNYN